MLAREERPAWSAQGLAETIADRVNGTSLVSEPFEHIEIGKVFPDDLYDQMLRGMPQPSNYRPMHGRSRDVDRGGRTPTRVKIDLFPEYIRHLPHEQRALWTVIGQALRSARVREAFRSRLAPALEKRFGEDFTTVGLFPIPILTRDIPGYFITPHTDTSWKGITVQLYLPKDDLNADVGTNFLQRLPDGAFVKSKKIQFVRNSGYAFAVGCDTWHSADAVHDRIKSRDSILLTYFVDQGALRLPAIAQKRLGNFLLNEGRQWLPPRNAS